MADLKLTDLTAITQANVDNNVLLYVVDVTGGTVDRKVTRQNLYLAVANTWTKGQSFTPDTATALAVTPPTGPTGSGSPFFAGLSILTATVAFATTAQTGDYDTAFIGQATLTNPSSGTITNAASLKIVGAPIASTNVTITNNYSLWVAGGVSRFVEQVKHTSTLNTALYITAASAPVGSSSEFVGGMHIISSTVAFVTTNQTGDYLHNKIGQATITNPTSATITNAATLKILGAPITGSNVTITNAYSLWVAAGTTLLQATTIAGTLTMSSANIALGSNSITTTTFTTNEQSAAFWGKVAVFIEGTSGNNSALLSLLPSGVNHSAAVNFMRTNAQTEMGYIGSDLVTTGEYAINVLQSGAGSLRPFNIYMSSIKLLSFDTANTITAYVNINLSTSSTNLLWNAAAATSGTTTQQPGYDDRLGAYWNGSASVPYGFRISMNVTATTPAASLYFQLNNNNTISTLMQLYSDGGLTIGAPTGASKGSGTLNVSTGIYLNGTAYTNPDYVFEKYYTGNIVKFAENDGAKEYQGLRTIADLENYVKTNYRFPIMDDKKMDLFRKVDKMLLISEELALYLFDHEKRLKALEIIN